MRFKKRSLIEGVDIKYHKFRGSEYASDFFENRFKNGKVLVYFDPDIDGLLAGYFACKSLSLRGIDFTWYINSNREHGFFLPLEKVKGMNLFCVDFLMDYDTIKMLVDAGCNVFSLDHHDNGDNFIEYENNGKKGVVINNQYGFEEESGRYLSGAGVVFESLIDYFGEEFNTRENRALVGVTLLSDIRNIENINARLYLQELYTHPYKGYIRYLIDGTIGNIDYSFGVPRLDRNYVDFILSPVINSCLRFNRQDEAVEFILGSGHISKKYHKAQKELVASLQENARVVKMSNLNVVIVDQSKFIGTGMEGYLSNFIGLLASQYLDGKRSVISYLVSGEKVGRASFRGRANGLNYLGELVKLMNGVGHGSAFGIRGLSPSKGLFLKANDMCAKIESEEDFSTKYIEARNMSVIVNGRGYDLGVENIYCLSQHRKYIKYTGDNVIVKRSSSKFKEYGLDGVTVMSFDGDLDPRKDLILPILERGVLCFYLNRKSED